MNNVASPSIQQIRQSVEQAKIVNLDFSYLSDTIEKWWVNRISKSFRLSKLELIGLISQLARVEDKVYFEKVGFDNIVGVSIENIFKSDSKDLSLIVHEAMSEIFHLNDTKYWYEEHKKLYLKPNGHNYKNWGNGYGEIAAHSDDLYEDSPVDLLSLTVCRDLTNTPTKLILQKSIIELLDDKDLESLLRASAKFISGKNVNIHKEKTLPLLTYSESCGVRLNLDFRIDDTAGIRMIPLNERDLFDKLRKIIDDANSVSCSTKTGTFSIIDNYKVLHSREILNLSEEESRAIFNINTDDDLNVVPRLLYRSKGPRYDMNEI